MTIPCIVRAALAVVAGLAIASAARADDATATLKRFPNCTYAGLDAGAWGARRLASYDDPAGRGVEVWCVRSMISAHYEIRISWNQPVDGKTATVRRMKTIAGCYFIEGDNKGPEISEDPAQRFTRVTWTNANPRDQGTAYIFSYDWATAKLTITATAAGKAPAVKVVDPPDDFEALRGLLPEP